MDQGERQAIRHPTATFCHVTKFIRLIFLPSLQNLSHAGSLPASMVQSSYSADIQCRCVHTGLSYDRLQRTFTGKTGGVNLYSSQFNDSYSHRRTLSSSGQATKHRPRPAKYHISMVQHKTL